MYAFISGTLDYVGNGYVVLDNNGIVFVFIYLQLYLQNYLLRVNK